MTQIASGTLAERRSMEGIDTVTELLDDGRSRHVTRSCCDGDRSFVRPGPGCSGCRPERGQAAMDRRPTPASSREPLPAQDSRLGSPSPAASAFPRTPLRFAERGPSPV